MMHLGFLLQVVTHFDFCLFTFDVMCVCQTSQLTVCLAVSEKREETHTLKC